MPMSSYSCLIYLAPIGVDRAYDFLLAIEKGNSDG